MPGVNHLGPDTQEILQKEKLAQPIGRTRLSGHNAKKKWKKI
jgi:hypothetical protein